jgi:hypothetical protein
MIVLRMLVAASVVGALHCTDSFAVLNMESLYVCLEIILWCLSLSAFSLLGHFWACGMVSGLIVQAFNWCSVIVAVDVGLCYWWVS